LAIGTPIYMSPEQILRPREVDHRTDVYSAAVVLFEMLAGRPPFDADSEYEIKKLQIEAPVPDVQALVRHVPPVVGEALVIALRKNPEERFASTRAFLRFLAGSAEPALAFPSPEVRTPKATSTGLEHRGSAAPRHTPWARWPILAAAVLGLVILGVVAVLSLRSPQSAPSAADATASPSPSSLPSAAELPVASRIEPSAPPEPEAMRAVPRSRIEPLSAASQARERPQPPQVSPGPTPRAPVQQTPAQTQASTPATPAPQVTEARGPKTSPLEAPQPEAATAAESKPLAREPEPRDRPDAGTGREPGVEVLRPAPQLRRYAIQQTGYRESQGTVLRIQTLTGPATVKSGDVTYRIRYVALSPDPEDTFVLKLSARLRRNGADSGLGVEKTVVAAGGGGIVETPFTLRIPAAAEKGTYTLSVVLEEQQRRLQRTSTFQVEIK
jgi:hypothetical protein